ncbi:MAG TPA: peptidylprolyl isomerase [Candidatus Thermoplasmatota archaeon]|nr:peptidylprolyl isomerase [Candidatus Thermoplasmatota archaeon]
MAAVVAGCAQQPEPPTATGATPATPTTTTTTMPATPGGGGGAPSAGCNAAPMEVDADWAAQKPRVRFETSQGDFVAELESEKAPITVQNFLTLAQNGTLAGTLFHRVIKDFVIQGGDPLSKDDDPANDGTGDGAPPIPDEFNPTLRHDAAGILSMANAGPNTGSSQFFVTLAATPHLDDRHSVFGRVVEGMDVVRAIGNAQVDSDDRPLAPITLKNVTLLDPAPYAPQQGAGIHAVVGAKKAEPGREARFAVILQNRGNVRALMAATAAAPVGWACTTDAPVVVPPGTGRVVFVGLTPPAGATGTTTIPLGVASSSGSTATTTVDIAIATLGAPVKQGDKVVANYAGVLPDGRLFDTSMQAVGTNAAQPKFNTTGGWREHPSYNTFPFTVGSGVIPGFTNLAKTAKVGETVTALIPAADAYATGDQYQRPLTGRDLVFELEIVRLA